ncbi:MAG: polysaccharide biosynthesis protein [Ignavibacteria bacterium]|nr:polysaccharide biosynthesis protein [Ignavibacteria bacterium]
MLLNYVYNQTQKLRNRHLLYFDIFFAIFSPLFALFLRLDGKLNFAVYGDALILYLISFFVIKILMLYNFRVYSLLWSKAGFDEAQRLGLASLLNLVIQVFLFNLFDKLDLYPFNGLPASLPYIDGIIFMLLCYSSRISIRIFEQIHSRRIEDVNSDKKVLILGAGDAGINIVQSMQRHPKSGYKPIAFLDDDSKKQKLILRGIPIIGKLEKLDEVVKKKEIDYIVIAMPRVSGKIVRQVAEICNKNKIKLLTVPSVTEILDGNITIGTMREIQIEDLLRRDPVLTDIHSVSNLLKGKRVLVTGAGGSIGSELCRQLIQFEPSDLILLGHGENSVFEIEQELLAVVKLSQFSKVKLSSFIADLRMKERLNAAFDKYRPQVVFHAAAHKHVPLMEAHPQEAISNNVIGTKNLVDTCIEYNIERFVGISTDKAVNPTSIMGATKRIGEMIILDAARKSGSYYSAVRFGNVLGSRGSVVRTFKKQIKKGGPITVTDPEMTRYFMTIPEAVQLVLQASALGVGGDVFVLDMGEPVKIMDLAKDMIKLSGLQEGVDVDIKITGLRPGEKLYEELQLESEEFERTEHQKIMTSKNASCFVSEKLYEAIEYVSNRKTQMPKNEIIDIISDLVPEFNHEQMAASKVKLKWDA